MTVPTFGGARPDRTLPLTFVLRASPADGEGEPVEETFHARPNLNWSTVMWITGSFTGMAGINALFEAALLPEDHQTFRQMVADPDLYLEDEALSAACNWLVEQYAARPTTPSSGSSAGRSEPEPTPEAKRYSPATVSTT